MFRGYVVLWARERVARNEVMKGGGNTAAVREASDACTHGSDGSFSVPHFLCITNRPCYNDGSLHDYIDAQLNFEFEFELVGVADLCRGADVVLLCCFLLEGWASIKTGTETGSSSD